MKETARLRRRILSRDAAVSVVGAVILFGLVGWVYPDLEARSRARATRKAWSQVITVFVDVVGICFASGPRMD